MISNYSPTVYDDKKQALSCIRPNFPNYMSDDEIIHRALWQDLDLSEETGVKPTEFYIQAGSADRSFNNIIEIDKNKPASKVIHDIMLAINSFNFDKSDTQSDYFHCGYYSSLNLGEFGKPLKLV